MTVFSKRTLIVDFSINLMMGFDAIIFSISVLTLKKPFTFNLPQFIVVKSK